RHRRVARDVPRRHSTAQAGRAARGRRRGAVSAFGSGVAHHHGGSLCRWRRDVARVTGERGEGRNDVLRDEARLWVRRLGAVASSGILAWCVMAPVPALAQDGCVIAAGAPVVTLAGTISDESGARVADAIVVAECGA